MLDDNVDDGDIEKVSEIETNFLSFKISGRCVPVRSVHLPEYLFHLESIVGLNLI